MRSGHPEHHGGCAGVHDGRMNLRSTFCGFRLQGRGCAHGAGGGGAQRGLQGSLLCADQDKRQAGRSVEKRLPLHAMVQEDSSTVHDVAVRLNEILRDFGRNRPSARDTWLSKLTVAGNCLPHSLVNYWPARPPPVPLIPRPPTMCPPPGGARTPSGTEDWGHTPTWDD